MVMDGYGGIVSISSNKAANDAKRREMSKNVRDTKAKQKIIDDNRFIFNCFIQKDTLVIFLDTDNNDILNIPMNSFFNFDYHDNIISLYLKEKEVIYTPLTPAIEVIKKIKDVMGNYYKNKGGF